MRQRYTHKMNEADDSILVGGGGVGRDGLVWFGCSVAALTGLQDASNIQPNAAQAMRNDTQRPVLLESSGCANCPRLGLIQTRVQGLQSLPLAAGQPSQPGQPCPTSNVP